MTILVSLSLAEICSAFPLNGSVYNWSRKLSKEKYAKETSFHVGWLYTFGSIAGMSTNNLASAMVLSQLIQIYFPDYQINNIDKIIFSNFINLLSTGVNLLKIE
jgi:amino acid transporter